MAQNKIFDIALGIIVMGTVGTLIGVTMGGGLMPVAISIGLGLGAVIGFLGGRRFLVSILVGAVLGGALAWLLAQGEDIVPIPGSRKPERVAENVGAANLVLTLEDLSRVREILPEGAFGERYSKATTPNWI